MKQRAVYATSGRRTLLWFDLVSDDPAPMGATVRLSDEPRFRATAVGARVQMPGCPDHTTTAMTPDQLADVCGGECDNPSAERNPIVRIDVVRIRPQVRPDEPVDGLIEDPWMSFPCEPDPEGCTIEFTDPDFVDGGRDTLYYVRALEEAIPTVNAGTLRVERDFGGDGVSISPCNVGAGDDCLAPAHPRAWSSPIFVEHSGNG